MADDLLDAAFDELDDFDGLEDAARDTFDESVPADIPELEHVPPEERAEWRDAMRADGEVGRRFTLTTPLSRAYQRGSNGSGGAGSKLRKELRREAPEDALARILVFAARKSGAADASIADATDIVREEPELSRAFRQECRAALRDRALRDPDFDPGRFPALGRLRGERR